MKTEFRNDALVSGMMSHQAAPAPKQALASLSADALAYVLLILWLVLTANG
jgi:hypothetical protein